MNASPDLSRPARILIVDDESTNREVLELMLGPEGYLLETASSGLEALAMVEHHRPDLILLDLMMPGIDGYLVTKKLKGNPATKNIPVIIVSALYDRNARLLGLGAGAEEFICKPIDRIELCMRIKNLLLLREHDRAT